MRRRELLAWSTLGGACAEPSAGAASKDMNRVDSLALTVVGQGSIQGGHQRGAQLDFILEHQLHAAGLELLNARHHSENFPGRSVERAEVPRE